MRVIKFRAWDYDEKRMIEDFQDTYMWEDYISSRYAVMQFTGLVDKHGKEIYESDIVYLQTKNALTNEPFEMVGEVFWRDGKYSGWGLRNNRIHYNHTMYGFPHDECKIIGNVFENKELLNEHQNL